MLFSEPKIPQYESWSLRLTASEVSVLFSEPKIPQFAYKSGELYYGHGFSALQRAENSSMRPQHDADCNHDNVSVLFSEPKIPQFIYRSAHVHAQRSVSVLFSEPKIPQFCGTKLLLLIKEVSVLFSEPKIPQCMRVFGALLSHRCFSALQRAENSSIAESATIDE